MTSSIVIVMLPPIQKGLEPSARQRIPPQGGKLPVNPCPSVVENPASPRDGHPHIFKNSASSMIFTPSFCALSSLEPASSPATTKSVFLLTLPLTLPPSASIFAAASSRLSVGNVPVSTKVFPANSPSAALGLYNADLKFTSAWRNFSISFLFRASPCQ